MATQDLGKFTPERRYATQAALALGGDDSIVCLMVYPVARALGHAATLRSLALVRRTIWAEENYANSSPEEGDGPNFLQASRAPAGAARGDRSAGGGYR